MKQEDFNLWSLVVQMAGTVVALLVVVLAVWGDWLKAKLQGPQLKVHLNNRVSETSDEGSQHNWHLKVANTRQTSPARQVRIICKRIEKKTANGPYLPQDMSIPYELAWRYESLSKSLPTIADEAFCDLGLSRRADNRFSLALRGYLYPPDFQGYITGGQSIRVWLHVSAENFPSQLALVLQIDWNGVWVPVPLEMANHLVITEVDIKQIGN